MMKYQHYFRASAKLILVARDKLAYLEDLSGMISNFELGDFTRLEEFGLKDVDLKDVASDDEDLLVVLTKSSEDAQANSVSETSLRPYEYASVVNLSLIFASRRGRALNTDAVAKIAEKMILGIGHTLGALYAEYQLGIGAETKVGLLYGSADFRFDATEEELAARKKERAKDILNTIANLFERMSGPMKAPDGPDTDDTSNAADSK